MKKIIKIIVKENLLELDQDELNKIKNKNEYFYIIDNTKIYINSLYKKDNVLYFIAKIKDKKSLFLVSNKKFSSAFDGSAVEEENYFSQIVNFTFENYLKLSKLFPFIIPISLRNKKTTIGCGDRLGLASAGHIRAAKKYDVYPVLAQQSIRELNFTKRNYKDVVTDTGFMVFQEGFERGYGADGDHLKTIEDIDVALDAGMPMITLDLSEVMNADAAGWSEDKINNEFEKLDEAEKKRLLERYADRSFLEDGSVHIALDEVKKCSVMYKKALDFAKVVDTHLRSKRGDHYDLEISIDETTTPTLPAHHLFIITELNHREITVNSLAPRFIGEFQKAIDYIGDLKEFEKQFAIHCRIAKENGNYKISVHSGSDKFMVYPTIGKYTDLRLHLKTAGTSWLEAVRCIAIRNPDFYRKLHKKAFYYYDEATKFYHITADISKIKDIDKLNDDELKDYLDKNESRQLIHITYGGLLNDPELREDFFRILDENEDLHYELLENHIGKHMTLLGVPRK